MSAKGQDTIPKPYADSKREGVEKEGLDPLGKPEEGRDLKQIKVGIELW
jgi:hypothetical protein